jgi:hypothetical protein
MLDGSETDNWSSEKCKDVDQTALPVLSAKNTDLLVLARDEDGGLEKIITDRNKATFHETTLHELIKHYPYLGIHAFHHRGYEDYKCKGPYIVNWHHDAVPWHPAIMGHRIRADHMAYVYIGAFKSALQRIKKSKLSAADQLRLLQKGTEELLHKVRPLPVRKFVNRYDIGEPSICLTEYVPRSEAEFSITNAIVAGANLPQPESVIKLLQSPDSITSKWSLGLDDAFQKWKWVEMARDHGYPDMRYVYYGSIKTEPLSLRINVQNPGKLFICEPRNRLEDPNNHLDFKHLWDSNLNVFLTSVSQRSVLNSFQFAEDSAARVEMSYDHSGGPQQYCIISASQLNRGNYVLTIKVASQNYVMIGAIVFS